MHFLGLSVSEISQGDKTHHKITEVTKMKVRFQKKSEIFETEDDE